MFLTNDAPQNHLLEAFLPPESERIFPRLELIELQVGDVLYEQGKLWRHVYFPIDCIISLLYGTEDGASSQIAMVGNEGMVGVTLFMGGETTTSHAVAQSAGQAYKLEAQFLKNEFNQAGSIMRLLLRYLQALITQMSQTAVCNRHHSINQQLCKWLLHSLDRLNSDELSMTQELIASMLGVRREGVAIAAASLQHEGIIHYKRGTIKVLDRRALENHACECYEVVKHEFERLLPPLPAKV